MRAERKAVYSCGFSGKAAFFAHSSPPIHGSPSQVVGFPILRLVDVEKVAVEGVLARRRAHCRQIYLGCAGCAENRLMKASTTGAVSFTRCMVNGNGNGVCRCSDEQ